MMARNRALGAATVAILRSVREGHRFGLDIMDATGLPSGTVYPTLARMEDRAFVESEWEDAGTAKDEGRPRRRYYRLTPEGARALSEALERLGLIAGASPRRAEQA
jgi:DNA-binding PadR family transcriptional regulator